MYLRRLNRCTLTDSYRPVTFACATELKRGRYRNRHSKEKWCGEPSKRKRKTRTTNNEAEQIVENENSWRIRIRRDRSGWYAAWFEERTRMENTRDAREFGSIEGPSEKWTAWWRRRRRRWRWRCKRINGEMQLTIGTSGAESFRKPRVIMAWSLFVMIISYYNNLIGRDRDVVVRMCRAIARMYRRHRGTRADGKGIRKLITLSSGTRISKEEIGKRFVAAVIFRRVQTTYNCV